MARILTQAALDSLKPSDRRREIPDGKIGGLYFVLQPSGSASWAYRYRSNGLARKLTLGSHPALSLVDARAAAKQAAADVAKHLDPAGIKMAARVEAMAKVAEVERPADLIADVVKTFIERHVKMKTRPRSQYEIQRIIAHDVLPEWGRKRLSDIKRADVHALLDGIVDRGPIMANRVLGVLKSFGRWSVERGVIDRSPFSDLRPPAPEPTRERVLDAAEIRALMSALDAEPYPLGPAIRLLILLGQRRSEISGMRWGEVNFDAGVWVLPAARAKNAVEHTLPLPADALSILRQLPRFASTDLAFSNDGISPAQSFTQTKLRLDKAMKATLGDAFKPWTIHDLRRTFASDLGELGIQPHVIEACLNHRSGIVSGIARTYNRHPYGAEMKLAFEAWSGRVREISSGVKPPANVVNIANRR